MKDIYKKSQVGIEFIILVGFVLFFFVVFLAIIEGNISDKTKEQKSAFVRDIALSVQNEIRLASQSSDGYYREFKIPEKIGNEDYQINITGNVVYIRTNDEKYAMTFQIENVTGEVIRGVNIIQKKDGKVKLNV